MSTMPLTACPGCSATVSLGTPFCGECGTPLGGTTPPETTPRFYGSGAPPVHGQATAPQSSIVLSAIALILAAIGLFMCGPFTSLPGIFLAWKDLSAAKAAGASVAFPMVALIANAVVTVLGLLGLGLMMMFFVLGAATI